MKQDIEFYSDGAKIKAHLYLPANADRPSPAVVLCHGFAGVKEMLVPPYAEAFAKAGFAALTFDYRGFGESEGTPGKLSPPRQVVDIRNAVTFARSLDEIDGQRIGLWGTSYGGANAISTAAVDNRIRCLCVQLTFGDGERVILGGKTDEEKAKVLDSIERIWTKEVTTNKTMMLGVNRFLTDAQSQQFYKDNVDEVPALKARVTFLTMRETLELKPERLLPGVRVPILIVSAEKDAVNPKEESTHLYAMANEPKSLYCIPGATHYEVYSGPHFDAAVSRQIAWFDNHL
jgi:dienelactone hydrolase